jgi:hypothetical protein
VPASQEQKVDFLLKKIGYSASKTGIAEDESAIGINTNTAKAPFEEGIPSPLIIPSTNILSDSSFIPTTPPGSDTAYVKVYPTTSALRMTRDSTVGTATRTYIAYTTYNDTSSARLTNWIDTQFGSSYILKVFKDDPTVPANELQQAGAGGGTDGWFFDYSSGVLNFNGNALPSGISATNIYIVGYRYIGATGVQPPAGIGTFHDLVVSNNLSVGGISTFTGNIDVDGHTELDNVNVSGIITSAAATVNGETILNGNVSFYGANYGAIWRKNNNRFQLTDNAELTFGSSNDTVIKHDNSNLLISNTTGIASVTGSVSISTNFSVGGISTFTGNIDANGIIEGIAGQNKIPSLYNAFSDLPNAGTYHGMFAHVHEHGRGYFAHGAAWYELVNKESNGVVGTGTEKYNLGFTDTVNLKVTGITTLGSIGISTGIISGPAVTYIDPATVGDNTGTVVIKGDLQIDGTQTTVNSSTMTVSDKNIEMAVGAANDAAADGGGITVKSGDGDKTWRWLNGTDSWTSSEHIRVPDGKVFGFASDTNTYIHRPAADTIAFTNGGGEKLRIASDGKVGINSTAPAAKFEVLGDSNLKGNLNVSGISTFTGAIDANGSLDVDGQTELDDLNVTGISTFNDDVNFTGTNYNAFWDKSLSALRFNDAAAIRLGSHQDLQLYHDANNSYIDHIGTGNLKIRAQAGSVELEGNVGISSNLSVSGVSTFTGNINANGNIVGDNATEITGITNVTGQNANSLKLLNVRYIGNTTTVFNTSFLHFSDQNVPAFGGGGNFTTLGAVSGLNLIFDTNNNDNNGLVIGSGSTNTSLMATHMVVSHVGNVGIGSTIPIGKLDVDGQTDLDVLNVAEAATFSDNVSIAGFSTFSSLVRANNGLTVTNNINVIGELNFTGSSAKFIDFETLADNHRFELRHHNPIGNLFETAIRSYANGSVDLFYNGTKKFSTSGTGVTITGEADVNGDLNVSGISTLSKEVGIGSALNVVGVSTFNDDVTITKDKDLIFDRFGTAKTRITYNDTLVVTQIKNVSEGLEIGYRPAHLMWLTNRVLSTKLGGIHVHGDLETDSVSTVNLNSTGISTFAGKVSAGGTTGTDGYYLQSTGVGVTWAQFPTMRTNQVFTATADQTTFSFSYNVGFLDVFVNGVKLPTSEFTASNGSSVILDDGCFVNDTVELISYNTVPSSGSGAQTLNQLDNVTITGVPVIGETLQHNGSAFVNDYTPSATTTSTSQTAILSLATATYRSVEYTVQITEGTKYHVTKILAIHDGTNVSFNEYGTLFTTSSLATFALDVNSGNMRLLATPASTNSTVFKVKFTGIKV